MSRILGHAKGPEFGHYLELPISFLFGLYAIHILTKKHIETRTGTTLEGPGASVIGSCPDFFLSRPGRTISRFLSFWKHAASSGA